MLPNQTFHCNTFTLEDVTVPCPYHKSVYHVCGIGVLTSRRSRQCRGRGFYCTLYTTAVPLLITSHVLLRCAFCKSHGRFKEVRYVVSAINVCTALILHVTVRLFCKTLPNKIWFQYLQEFICAW
jgi:hypothetical protein